MKSYLSPCNHRNVLCLVVILAAPVPGALAGSLIYNSSTSVPLTATDWTGDLTFPQFDSALGTLTEVDLNVSVDYQTQWIVTNNAGSASSGKLQTELQVNVLDPEGNWSSADPIVDAFSSRFSYSLPRGQSVTSPLYSATVPGVLNDGSAAIMTEFTGSGTINITGNTSTYAYISASGGNSTFAQSTAAGLTGSITYLCTAPTFSTVPAPSALVSCSIGLGISGLMAMGRRNRRCKVR